MNTAIASHRSAPSRFRIRPLVASLGLALALGAADSAIALPGFAAGIHPNRPLFGMSGPLRRPGLASRAATKSLPSAAPSGGTLVVQNCADSGAGSLRDTIATAPDDATITFGDLACSTITLTSGAIAIAQESLHIEGPGRDDLGIDGNDLASVFRHSGYGALSIRDLTIANGRYDIAPQQSSGSFGGGCIFSSGRLELTGVTVENCMVDVDVGQAPGILNAAGGGVLAYGTLSLDHTIIRNCQVKINANDAYGYFYTFGGGAAALGSGVSKSNVVTNSHISGNSAVSVEGTAGGGLYVHGDLNLTGSTIENNSALATGVDVLARGGGIFHQGVLLVQDSTFSGNQGGGIYTQGNAGSSIRSSTISGNQSDGIVAGILCMDYCAISNSTVVFNEAASDSYGYYDDVAAGISIRGTGVLQSVVIAGNEAAGLPADFYLFGTSSVTGSDNLIFAPLSTPPTGTIVGEDPLLAPLANNGGPTATHALLSGSPALDVGNNDAELENDQRGAGFPRVVGAAADIGAFEFEPASLVVENCADSGADSLRDIIAGAPEDATITFGDLACSTITLTSGAIEIAQENLHIDGPGRDDLGVDGNSVGSVFRHSGTGELSINGLTIANGRYDSAPEFTDFGGGCVSSAGDVELTGVTVEHCVIDVVVPTQEFGSTRVAGGGVLAFGDLTLNDTIVRECAVHVEADSTPNFKVYAYGGGAAALGAPFLAEETIVANSLISGNQVSATENFANGGGLFVSGNLSVTRSTIENNSALSAEGDRYARGGGIRHFGALMMSDSTISGNHSGFAAGIHTLAIDSSTITNSTISGNLSDGVVAGIYCYGDCQIRSSTVAFNAAASDSIPYYAGVAAGVVIFGAGDLRSVVIAGNEAEGLASDLLLGGDESVLTGSDNLIVAPLSTPPAGTIVGEDPLLAPLASNGGPTATHALMPGSPALDTGNNDAGLENDQRGAGFPRVVGANADIGAFEFDPDPIFRNGFD